MEEFLQVVRLYVGEFVSLDDFHVGEEVRGSSFKRPKAKKQDLAGHASIATIRLYDRRESRPEDPPVNLVAY